MEQLILIILNKLVPESQQPLKLSQEKLVAQIGVKFPILNCWEGRSIISSLLAFEQIGFKRIDALEKFSSFILWESSEFLQIEYSLWREAEQ